MPIAPASEVTDIHAFIGGDQSPLPAAPLEEYQPFMHTAMAAVRQNSTLASWLTYNRLKSGDETPVAGFDGLNAIAGTPYELHASQFIDARSRAEVERIRRQVDLEEADARTLHESGAKGFAASLAAGATDPLLLASMAVPGLGEEAAASRLGAFVRTAVRGGLTEIPIEATLQATQATRTPIQGAVNVAGATLLSGLLGAALLRRIPKAELDASARAFEEDFPINPNSAAQSYGAAAAGARTTLAQETIASGGQTIAKTIGRTSPELRLMTSPSTVARQVTQDLSETPFLLEKNLQGIATPAAVETELKGLMGNWWQAYKIRGELFSQYRAAAREAGERVMTRTEFNEEIAAAMRRGDQHLVAQVAEAARKTRSIVYEPLRARAVALGLLTEGDQVTGAMSYQLRQYDVAKIRAHMSDWMELLRRGFSTQGVDSLDALDLAHQVTRNILGSERGTLDTHAMDGVVPKSGRLKERTLKLPDEHLEPYLVGDIDKLSQAYLQTLGPEVAITERFGDRELKGAFQRIYDDYAILKTRAARANDDPALEALQKAEERDVKDLSAIRDRMYGTFGAPKDPTSFFVRAGRFVRGVNYLRLLGGQVVSSLTDFPRLLMTYGMPKVAASGVKLATSLKALNLARNEARRMAVGLDMVMNTRGVALGDLNASSSFAEQRVIRRLSDVFSIASLQSPWNAVLKSWASVMSQDDILAAAAHAAEGRLASKVGRARFASLGLDSQMMARVAEQARLHGRIEQGLRFAQSDHWTDTEAAYVFENAIRKEADIAVLQPGHGDTPRVASTEWGKALLQFKSFNLASTSRLVIPMLQGWRQADIKMMAGTMALFGVGAAVYALKQITADQPIETDPKRFAAEVVDKTGVLAWTGDIIFPALWQFGNDDLSRWSDRQPVETLAGPVAGTIADAYTSRWPKRLLDGDLSAADVHKLRRLLPGQNLFYLRHAINELENQVAPQSMTTAAR